MADMEKSYAERLADWAKKKRGEPKPFTRGEKLSWLLTLVAFIFLFFPQLMLMDAYGYSQLDTVDKTLWWVVGIWVQLGIALGFGTITARAKIKQELNLR